ncbi:SANT/Myb domain-containing protein [Cinnamomum micranthum f. kanehirae]|uniref:SANT/Myb domain-containing protein n=1 Tax=Cinnamomum micranthum f. kanehirae TaxID=337451 RepID=A0A3S4PFI2_9MAGN|nr:SANT/Myb domain-containing protein [Cinnamomum micranthum f. kanehirae]
MAGRCRDDGLVMRKGPWMAEEDEILMDYVKKYGPRDWSSIQSKGLLPRTGKSCRLRWVNKLKPNLKTGCKFSAEEERIVIDLQAQFGNKWAKISTYLPGRTDNDVKNFWSTRQKRLARMLQTTPPPKSHKHEGKVPVLREETAVKAPRLNSMPQEESSKGQSSESSYMGKSDIIEMVQLQDLVKKPNLFNFDTSLPPLEYFDVEMMEKNPCLNLPFAQPSQMPLDITLLQESQGFINGVDNTNSLGLFPCQEALELDDALQLPLGMQFSELDGQLGGKQEVDSVSNPKTYIGDFPADMLDYFESTPSMLEW